ncbi:hypothetical protein EDD16DRAFT_63386 [Pisolithus croceorrhizus]|nr:hypothetical protein EDD16DRAFT_63386 [Pisolithus croceorrhizus]
MILAVAGLCIVVGPTCNPKPYEPPRFHPIFWGIIATSGLLKGYGLSRVNPAATGLLHSPLDITMCFRLTQLTEFSCGHIPLQDSKGSTVTGRAAASVRRTIRIPTIATRNVPRGI